MDKRLTNILNKESNRQSNTIELIASENFASDSVMELAGSIFTNKYAEGYPGKRYYNGCDHMDEVETLAIEELKKLYDCNFANVQPHCGANANTAVFQAFLKPGDTILGMDLASGGHLSHGSKPNISGKVYDAHSYGVDDNGYLNYDDIRTKALEVKPKMLIAGASAYSRIIDWKKFREIADEVGAILLVDMAHYSGLIAGGKEYCVKVKENANHMCDIFRDNNIPILTDGTDSHLILIDLSTKKHSGRVVADKLEENGITVNKNGIPNDPRSFVETSGIRIGTAAETTRGHSIEWFKELAREISKIINK